MCRIPRSLKHPTVSEDERTPPSQITLSAQTASLIVGSLSDVGCWDVTPLIESHNRGLVWTAPSAVYRYCNHHNNLAPRNIKWWCGSCRNLHCSLWSGRSRQSVRLTLQMVWRLQRSALSCLPVAAAYVSTTSIVKTVLATKATERLKSGIKDKCNPGLTLELI